MRDFITTDKPPGAGRLTHHFTEKTTGCFFRPFDKDQAISKTSCVWSKYLRFCGVAWVCCNFNLPSNHGRDSRKTAWVEHVVRSLRQQTTNSRISSLLLLLFFFFSSFFLSAPGNLAGKTVITKRFFYVLVCTNHFPPTLELRPLMPHDGFSDGTPAAPAACSCCAQTDGRKHPRLLYRL